MKHNVTCSKMLVIAFVLLIILLGQFHYVKQSEARAVKYDSPSNASLQDLCSSLGDLRGSIRTASDYTSTLTSPASSISIIVNALSKATESLEDVRQMVKQIMGPCYNIVYQFKIK